MTAVRHLFVLTMICSAAAIAGAQTTFRVGEQLSYDLRLTLGIVSFGRVGDGRMEILSVETVRDRPAWHLRFRVHGSVVGFAVDDSYDSWVDTATFASLRHEQTIHEGRYRRHTVYEIYPDHATFTKNGGAEAPGVSRPLDDGSFLYFLRTVSLEAGQRMDIPRYFKPANNPVSLVVDRRETIDVPAGRFETTVLRPVIRTGGIFGEGGRAELWLSRDERHVMVRLRTHVAFGTIDLTLRNDGEAAALARAGTP